MSSSSSSLLSFAVVCLLTPSPIRKVGTKLQGRNLVCPVGGVRRAVKWEPAAICADGSGGSCRRARKLTESIHIVAPSPAPSIDIRASYTYRHTHTHAGIHMSTHSVFTFAFREFICLNCRLTFVPSYFFIAPCPTLSGLTRSRLQAPTSHSHHLPPLLPDAATWTSRASRVNYSCKVVSVPGSFSAWATCHCSWKFPMVLLRGRSNGFAMSRDVVRNWE